MRRAVAMKLAGWMMVASLVAAWNTATAATLPVTVTLQDGTRLIGRTSRSTLPFQLGPNIVTNLPLDQIRAVTRLAESGAHRVELGDGTTWRGAVGEATWTCETVLGPVEIHWAVVEELQVDAAAGPLTWLSAAGAVGIERARGGELIVSGGRAWTRETFFTPLVIECDVMLAERLHNGSGWLEVALVHGSKRAARIERPASARLLCGAQAGSGPQDGVELRQMNTAQNTTRRPGQPSFGLAPGVWHRLRWEVRATGMRFALNGRVQELGGVPLPAAPLAVELSSDATATRWRVRNLTVRGSAGPVARDVRAGRLAPQPDSIRELTDWLAGTFLGRPAL